MLILQEQTEQTWSSGSLLRKKIKPVFDMTSRILLVTNYDDSPWSRLTVSMIAQFGVPKLTRFMDIYKALQDLNVAAVIMDDDPSVDTPTLVTHIRASHPSIPILIATNSVSWIRARRLIVAGASDYFFATLDEVELLHTLQVHLGDAVGED